MEEVEPIEEGVDDTVVPSTPPNVVIGLTGGGLKAALNAFGSTEARQKGILSYLQQYLLITCPDTELKVMQWLQRRDQYPMHILQACLLIPGKLAKEIKLMRRVKAAKKMVIKQDTQTRDAAPPKEAHQPQTKDGTTTSVPVSANDAEPPSSSEGSQEAMGGEVTKEETVQQWTIDVAVQENGITQ